MSFKRIAEMVKSERVLQEILQKKNTLAEIANSLTCKAGSPRKGSPPMILRSWQIHMGTDNHSDMNGVRAGYKSI